MTDIFLLKKFVYVEIFQYLCSRKLKSNKRL